MNLHNDLETFKDLIQLTSSKLSIPEDFVRRDYYIVLILKRLSESEYSKSCIFKGGTSLSKCYPGSIERFSEDIDLTYVPIPEETNKQIELHLKRIENLLSVDCSHFEKIDDERNCRNKSSNLFYNQNRVKLEIGSSIKPDPVDIKYIRSFIHEYLESIGRKDALNKYEIDEVQVYSLRIERTFLDKVFAIKRHAMCGTLNIKVRHIYDVVRLMNRAEIKLFLNQKEELKRLVHLTKSTDHFYLEKRVNNYPFDPLSNYDLNSWIDRFDNNVRKQYESLHESILLTNIKQNLDDALKTLNIINNIFIEIDE